MANAADIQNLYIAYFKRPADVAGLTYWTSGAQVNFTTVQIAQLFSQQTEYANAFANFTMAQTVNALYRNLFNHDADPSGLSYWVGQINNGTFTIGQAAIAILTGALGTDAATVAAKFTAASAFTAKMAASPAAQATYSATNGNAYGVVKTWLGGVVDAGTGTSAASKLDALFTTMANSPAVVVPGVNSVVNPGVTNLGTAGNDIFNATDATLLTAGTSISGNGGTDVLNVTSAFTDAAHPAVVTGVTTLNLQQGGTMQQAVAFMSQFTTINDNSTNDYDSIYLGSVAQTINLNNAAGSRTVHLGAPNQVINQIKTTGEVGIISTNANLAGAKWDMGNALGGAGISITDAGTATLSAVQMNHIGIIYLAGSENLTFNPVNDMEVITGFGSTVNLTAFTTNKVIVVGSLNQHLTLAGSANYQVELAGGGDNGTVTLAGTGNVVLKGSGTGNLTVTGGAGIETIYLASTGGVDNIAVSSSTLGHIATNLITISNFKINRPDALHFGNAASSLGTINIASSDFGSLATNITNGAGNLTNNDYKAFMVNVASGAAAGTYVVEHTAGTTVGSSDIIVKLIGATGSVAVGDLQA
ncbi:beta strand repeat-containing protein [Undibacterium sp. Di26W]|uniref:beta strand repeat-containing protein n=1 Tax=Undibacterium sp. Di26W TaxID=3413035 RepID=UPI003BF3DA64